MPVLTNWICSTGATISARLPIRPKAGVCQFYFQNFKLEESDTKEESLAEDFLADENIYAVYAMATHYWGKSMLLAGLRYERTDISYQGYDLKFKEFSDAFEGVDTLKSKRSYQFLLPQIHYKYSPDNRTNLRAALTWTYSRPNFEDICLTANPSSTAREITLGNPELRFAKSINFDLLAEKYLDRGGLISGGLFYKNIEDFIYYFEQRTFVENISRPGWYFVTTAQNGLRASVYGAEISWNQQFFKLPGALRHFGIYFNYTFTYSSATIDNRNNQEEEISLPGQSPHALNLALFFDSKKLYAKLAANFNDAFLDELGIKKSWDVYYDRNLHLDFNMNYKLSRQVQFY
ncbi:MAG: outer membrane beta-barrel protein, partial [Saprospirales bacterium]|nr:outer membrane beta-barrel protein [Saprospirales bacterium]